MIDESSSNDLLRLMISAANSGQLELDTELYKLHKEILVGAEDRSLLLRKYNIIPLVDILSMENFPRQQNHLVSSSQEDGYPKIVLFISHKWETALHPDPTGKQLRALQQMFRLILDVICGKQSITLRHGSIQAAVLASRIIEVLGNEEGYVNRETVLQSVGIFYDFSSLPQEPFASVDESEKLQAGLRSMTSLICMSDCLIAVRSRNDDYDSRCWCAAESAHRSSDAIILRTDLWDQEIESKDFISYAVKPFDELREMINKHDEASQPLRLYLRKIRELYHSLQSESGVTPHFVFDFLVSEKCTILRSLSRSSLESDGLLRHGTPDLHNLVIGFMDQVGLVASKEQDKRYLAMLIPMGIEFHVEWKLFYAMCAVRVLLGRTLRLKEFKLYLGGRFSIYSEFEDGAITYIVDSRIFMFCVASSNAA